VEDAGGLGGGAVDADVHTRPTDTHLLEHHTDGRALLGGVVNDPSTELQDPHAHSYGRFGHGTEYSNSHGSLGS
jgi:hypothetical protein